MEGKGYVKCDGGRGGVPLQRVSLSSGPLLLALMQVRGFSRVDVVEFCRNIKRGWSGLRGLCLCRSTPCVGVVESGRGFRLLDLR